MVIDELGRERLRYVAGISPRERFVYWVKERHQIYLKRRAGVLKPWTVDPVLQSYFFTNPYRENDKVTQWFRSNIRDPLKAMPEVVFATVCFRWFNWPETGKLLQGYGLLCNWDCEAAVTGLRAVQKAGHQVFTGAFNISNSGSTKPKINRVCEDYIQPVWEDRLRLLEQIYTMHAQRNVLMQGVHGMLKGYPGLGGSGFMAYEVVCDLRYTWVLQDAMDKLTWSNPGPGAKRGLNRMLGRDLSASCKDYLQQSVDLLRYANAALPRYNLEMREIEHSLCEWDKYERARLGDGHMKRRYNGL